jgi:ketosteroid isomerase-like protein
MQQSQQLTSEQQIREILAGWSVAIEAKDLSRVMAIYAPHIRSFDAIQKLQFRGVEVYRAHWENCMSHCGGGPSVFQMAQLEVEANADLAFSHALIQCGGTNEQGEVQGCWMRTTQCWRKTAGQWQVVHEHFSVPFDMVSNEAMFSLQPD